MEQIAKQLKRHRLKRGMTQKEFAKHLGINYQNFLALEHGRHNPGTTTIRKLLKHGIKIKFL